eukprot:scaffold13561_cov108-Phaeocystis_antarctica.AAC.1
MAKPHAPLAPPQRMCSNSWGSELKRLAAARAVWLPGFHANSQGMGSAPTCAARRLFAYMVLHAILLRPIVDEPRHRPRPPPQELSPRGSRLGIAKWRRVTAISRAHCGGASLARS